MKIDVTASTFGTHTHQIFCGLNLLKLQGSIDLSYKSPPEWLKNRTTRQLVHCVQRVDGKTYNHIYDLNDSDSIASTEALEHCDFYHKRSYSKSEYRDTPFSERIFPLGLNYQVQAESLNDLLLRAAYDFLYYPYNPFASPGKSQAKEILKYARDYFLKNSRKKQILRYNELEKEPHIINDGHILFQCRLWDPKLFPPSARDHIEHLNCTRTELVEKLSETFGRQFVGGLQPCEYSLRTARGLVVEGPTNRKSYLELVNSAAVVITTNGISDSIGWKMGEFVAASKAILCERTKHQIPGTFQNGTHYIEYHDSKDCIEYCKKLLETPELRLNLSQNCYRYYRDFVRPDSIVLNSLKRYLLHF